jgi:nitrogen fixation NifU-like protein
MAGLEDLYREIILDHYKSPRNRGELEPPARQTKGFNPLCGDEVVVSVLVDGDKIVDVRTTGQGCSISQSSASMMSAAVKGLSVDEVTALTTAFKSQLGIHDHDADDDDATEIEVAESGSFALGELEALKGVMKFPSRIKCATLAWNTLVQALDAPDGERA